MATRTEITTKYAREYRQASKKNKSAGDYIESWYNRQRPNARADHRVPVQAWADYRGAGQTGLAA